MAPQSPAAPPKPDPRPGRNPGYDDENPRGAVDLPQDAPDARGENFGKLPNPEAGGLDRPTGADPDPTTETPAG